MVWDVTVVSTLVLSYVNSTTTGVGAVVEMAAERKAEKYQFVARPYFPDSYYGELGCLQLFIFGFPERAWT